jgi:SSS family transporter
MHALDWIVLFSTLALIAFYGIYKNRKQKSLDQYLNSGHTTPWWVIGLSIMATQASAITFLSTPGLGYENGLKFVQFYFGMPIALLIVAYGFAPLFHRQKVHTAYEYLENKFDLKVRLLAASLFLMQRGMAAGITIYAPSIVLTLILGWPLWINIVLIGLVVISYTVVGGDKAVTQTHMQQMAVIFVGIFVAFGAMIYMLQPYVGIPEIIDIAKVTGRWTSIDTTFNLNERYNVWSGIIGGTFLMLSYFGTDQSQVQRYLSGKSLKEIRTGLFFNAVLKIPMQYFILFTGVLLFAFYQFHKPPESFDKQLMAYQDEAFLKENQSQHTLLFDSTQKTLQHYLDHKDSSSAKLYRSLLSEDKQRQDTLLNQAKSNGYKPQVKSSDFVFITFILDFLPAGIIGLLLAMIFSAAMSSTSAELSALSTTSHVDFLTRLRKNKSKSKESKGLFEARMLNLAWGILAIGFALMANMFENLVEAVNLLGSLFYGTVLGIFLASLFAPKSSSGLVFIGALLAQTIVLLLFFFESSIIEVIGFKVSYLWFNLIASTIVCGFAFSALIIEKISK